MYAIRSYFVMELNISVLFVSEDKWQTIQRNLVSENFIQNFEAELLHKSGKTLHILFNAVLRNEVVTATLLDLTAQKRQEWDLQLLKYAVNSGGDEVYVITRDTKFVWVNQRACEFLGYSPYEMLNLSVSSYNFV